MKKFTQFRLALVASVLALTLPMTIEPAHSATSDATFTGVVSCARCHGLHARKGTNRLSCSMLCVSQDSHYVLMTGEKIYALEGDKNKIQNFAGGDATVTGHLSGDTLEETGIDHRQSASR